MRVLDLTLPTPRENLALDESLFRELEAGGGECLRFWESPAPFVAVGRGGRIEEEVDLAACADAGIPVLRRASGGGAVVLGPGCLCFALVLRHEGRPDLRDVARSYERLLDPIAAALALPGLARVGSDLALGGRKVSGNAQLRGRLGLLHHGTLLHGFERSLLPRLLREPRRRPRYRGQRGHLEFVGDLPLPSKALKLALAAAWEPQAARVE
ncbi:MAG TPA: lipoate--protein ligase family protein [Vicinamibacteria bacterium]